MEKSSYQHDLKKKGFCVIERIYSSEEIAIILLEINNANSNKNTFRKTDDLFAIRQFLKEIPAIANTLFNENLVSLINNIFGEGYFVVKTMYFDKPERSNWFVSWHQDLTISVDKKVSLPGYGPWTTKQDQFAVQPPLNILKDNFTIRIHLDHANEGNGALKVIPASHLKGIYRQETINWQMVREEVCVVKAGGVMIMRPLLMHASSRTTNAQPRKVIHIEFSKTQLPNELNWSEKQTF